MTDRPKPRPKGRPGHPGGGGRPGAPGRRPAAPPPPESPDAPPLDDNTLTGTVERLLYTNPETGYTVAALRPEGRRVEVTFVGNLSGLQPQEVVKLEGQWTIDRRYGRQFKVESYESVLPQAGAAIERYLGGGLIKGIGKAYAKKLVEHFGEGVFEAIDQRPESLRDVPGIGPMRAERIAEGWNTHRALRDIMVFVQKIGLPQNLANRVFRQYGDTAIERIRTNPYQLALDVKGIGFKTADSVAMRLGIPVQSVERAKAGVHCILQDQASDGHTFMPADPLIQMAVETLGIDTGLVVEGINALKAGNHVVLEVLPDGTKAVYPRNLHAHEKGAAERVARLLDTGKLLPKMDIDAEIAKFEARNNFHLAPNQRAAVRAALRGGVVVVTGGPGTGKTTIVRAMLAIMKVHGVQPVLAAPTGRAAKRMYELTRTEASTIHRLLKFDPKAGGFQANGTAPLRGDIFIVDEASMVDIALGHALLRAIPPTSSVVFVGDVDQLPSVGPGNFLADLIQSGTVPVARLNEIFRQARASLIVTNAHRINQGQVPSFGGKPAPAGTSQPNRGDDDGGPDVPPPDDPAGEGAKDFHFFDAETPEDCLKTVLELVQTRIPAKFGFHPAADIQVLSPMRRGVLGTANLNMALQGLLNPGLGGLTRGGVTLKAGDKVIQTANDYDKDVFNGDIGTVATVDGEDHALTVNYDGRIVHYGFDEADDLELAYAMTIHKSQGSEYKCVVIPVHTTHFVMLRRDLLYTGVTRGKKLVCLVGQRRAVRMAVDNASAEPRWSALAQRLAALRADRPSPGDL